MDDDLITLSCSKLVFKILVRLSHTLMPAFNSIATRLEAVFIIIYCYDLHKRDT